MTGEAHRTDNYRWNSGCRECLLVTIGRKSRDQKTFPVLGTWTKDLREKGQCSSDVRFSYQVCCSQVMVGDISYLRICKIPFLLSQPGACNDAVRMKINIHPVEVQSIRPVPHRDVHIINVRGEISQLQLESRIVP